MKPRHFIISILLTTSIQALPVTIHDVLQRIATDNPALQSAEAANVAEELSMRSENTLPPTSIEYSPFFRPGVGGVASSELIVSQEFDFPSLYASRSRQTSLEREALDATMNVARRDLLLEARNRLLDLILLNKTIAIIRARISDTQSLLMSYERALNLGSVTILDVNKVRLTHNELQRQMLENEAEAESCINGIIALNGNRKLDLSDLEYGEEAESLPVPDDLKELALGNVDLLSAAAELKAAEHGVKLAKSGWLPGFTVGYRRNTEEHSASNGFLIGASLPLFSNSAKSKAAQARLASSRLKLDNTIAQSNAEITTLVELLIRQRNLYSTYDLSLITETLDLYRKSLEAGQIPVTTYYTEIDALYETLLTRARLENDIHRTYARLTASLL